MDYKLLVSRLKNKLREKYPGEKNHARLLSEILGIRENSVYRKLNGDRQFSLEDLATLCRTLSVSIESLLEEKSDVYSHPMELVLTKNMPAEQRRMYMEETTRTVFEQAAQAGYSQFMGVCKNIPIISYCHFGWLMKFARMKWFYFNNCLGEIVPLAEMDCPDAYVRIKEIYMKTFVSFRKLVFIVDGDMIRNFIVDIGFFRKIGYLTADDVYLLLDDLERLLTTIEEICREGYTQNPEQEIAVFYSDISLYNDMYLIESTTVNQGIFFAQGFIPILHKDVHTFKVLREWVSSCVRSSNPICGVADLDRKAFFEKQYRLVEEGRKSVSA
ncbi:MAG: helix-turn-helix domain-containing protein [Bacteroides sp.]|nr:helix-turn-helix domain-containing protein [Bacteroides sp.]